MSVICPSCEKEVVSESYKYCPFCGTEITSHNANITKTEDVRDIIVNELQQIYVKYRGGEYEKRIGTTYYDGDTSARISMYNIAKITAEQEIQPLIEKLKEKDSLTVNDRDYVYSSFKDIFYINHIQQFKEIEDLFNKLDKLFETKKFSKKYADMVKSRKKELIRQEKENEKRIVRVKEPSVLDRLSGKTRPCMGCGKIISDRYDYCDDCYKSYKEKQKLGQGKEADTQPETWRSKITTIIAIIAFLISIAMLAFWFLVPRLIS